MERMFTTLDREDDLALGQAAVVIARWVLVLAGLLVALWAPGGIAELRVQLGVVFLVAVANFHLTSGLLRRRVAVGPAATLASVGDIAMITLLVVSQGGLKSDLYVFYFPALLAITLAFRTDPAIVFTLGTATLYGAVAAFGVRSDADMQTVATRVAMLVAVGACGIVSWRIEQARRATRRAAASGLDSEARESAADLFFGQAAILWARWFVLGTAMLLALWSATTTTELIQKVAPVVVLLAMNFYLHARYAMERPANRALLTVAGAIDLLAVGAILLTWPGGQALQSPLFVLAYPLLAAFALVFRPFAAALFAAAAVGAYAAVCLATNPALLADAAAAKTLVLRMLTLGATAALGAYYWRALRAARRSRAIADPERDADIALRAAPTPAGF